jgi:hypothetical protein
MQLTMAILLTCQLAAATGWSVWIFVYAPPDEAFREMTWLAVLTLASAALLFLDSFRRRIDRSTRL